MVYYSIKKTLKPRFFAPFSIYNFFRENIKIYCKIKAPTYYLLCLKKIYDKNQRRARKKLVDTGDEDRI